MHIFHLSTSRSLRGGEKQLKLLHEALLERGIGSTLCVASRGELSRLRIPGCMTHSWRGPWDLPGLVSLLRGCRHLGPSHIHCHDARAFTAGSIVGARLALPVIVSRKVLFPIRSTPLNRWKYSRSRHVICVSAAVAETVRRFSPGTPVSVIHDCAELAVPLKSREESRSRLGVPRDALVIGCVGYFTKEKNLPLLIELASRVEREHPEVRVVAVGHYDEKAIGKRPLPSSLILTGHVPEAVTYYNAFDIYVSVSTREGLGSALLDAIVRDVPSAALDSGGGRDLFEPYRHRFAAKPSELSEIVLSLIDGIEDAGREAARHGAWARAIFSKAAMVDGHVSVYRNTESLS